MKWVNIKMSGNMVEDMEKRIRKEYGEDVNISYQIHREHGIRVVIEPPVDVNSISIKMGAILAN